MSNDICSDSLAENYCANSQSIDSTTKLSHEPNEITKNICSVRNIHTFGDSHAIDGWIRIHEPVICRHHTGPFLCYTIGNKRENIFEMNKHHWNLHNTTEYVDVQDNDMVIFSFGEIDCRCHIHKHITETVTYQEIIDDIIKKYFETIIEITSKYNNLHICIYNIVPTVDSAVGYVNHDYPLLGTDDQRREYVLYFNQMLKKMCNMYNLIFFDIYDKYTDENGYMNQKLSDGAIHIQDPKYIKEFLLQILDNIDH